MTRLEEKLENVKTAIILFHIDTDGVCSAKITGEALKRLGKEVITYCPATPKLLKSSEYQSTIDENDPDLIVLVDVALSKNSSLYQENKSKEFLVLDHHGVKNKPRGGEVLYFNPKLEDDNVYTPASKLCYDVFNEVVDVKDLDWVAAVGLIGDSGAPQNKEFVEDVVKKYDLNTGEDEKYYFDSFLGTLSEMINSGKIVKGKDGALTGLRLLKDAATPSEFYENSYQLREWNDNIQNYLEECVMDFKHNREEIRDLNLYFYTFRPEYTIGSVLSTIVSFEEPHKTVIIFSKKNGVTTMNLRRQDKEYHMGLLAERTTEPFKNAGGGGHRPAAGGHIRTDDLNKVKKKFIIELKKMMK